MNVTFSDGVPASSPPVENPPSAPNAVQEGTLTLIRGVDYSPELGNAPEWSESGWNSAWLGASATFRYQQDRISVGTVGSVTLSHYGNILTAKLTLSAEETSGLLASRPGSYEVEVESSGGKKRLIGQGDLHVIDRVPN